MKTEAHLRAWRAVMLTFGLICFGSAELKAGTLLSPGPSTLIRQSVEPFGLFVFAMSGGDLRQKWFRLREKLDDDMVQLALCDGDRDGCVSPAALKLLAIVDAARAREGRARLGETNRAINLAIRPMSDLAQYGENDVWNSPLATFKSGAGDCEDYAIAKLAALRLAGVPADDLRIVVMRDMLAGEEHAVAAARLDGRWLILDNRRMAMIEDDYVRNYQPLFVIYQSAVMKYAETPHQHLRDQTNAAQLAAVNTDSGDRDGLMPPTD